MNGAQWEAFFLPPLFAGRRRGHSAFSFISARRRSAGKFPALFLPGIKKAARRRFPLCRFYQDRNMSHRVFAKKSTSTARMIFFTEPAPFRWKYRAPR